MIMSRRFARWHKVLNLLAVPLASRGGGLLLLEHVGRRSGKAYQTPLRGFLRDGQVVVGLNFGARSDWLANLRAAPSARLTMRGVTYVTEPPRVVDIRQGPQGLPRWYWWGLQHVTGTEQLVLLRVHRAAGS